MNQKLSIKIKIADREYPMQVDAEMEGKLRLAGKMLNEKINAYAQQLGIQNKQDLIAMTAFDCMVELLTTQKVGNEIQEMLMHKIISLNELTSSAL